MAKTKISSNSDPNTNDIPDMSFEQAMSIIAQTPKSVVDESMKEFKERKKIGFKSDKKATKK